MASYHKAKKSVLVNNVCINISHYVQTQAWDALITYETALLAQTL